MMIRFICAIGILAGSALAACTGLIGDGADPSGPGSSSGANQPGANDGQNASSVVTTAADGHIRRLTNREFLNSVQDVFGDTMTQAIIPPDSTNTGFDNDFASMSMSDLVIQNLQTMAESVAAGIRRRLSTLLTCSTSTPLNETDCVGQFITKYGRLAYRRALTFEAQKELFGVFTYARGLTDFQTSVQTVASAILQSPNFMYRLELGPNSPGLVTTVVRLTPYEVATELSYYLWAGPPDDALLTAAENGGLDDDAGVALAVARLIQDPRAQRSVSAFTRQWLGIDTPDALAKSQSLYPTFSPQVSNSLVVETTTFVNDVIFNGDASLTTLLTSNHSFANADVAAIYGLNNGPTGSAYVAGTLDPTERAGVLSQPSVIAASNPPGDVIPVLVGKLVRERLLCQRLAPPPNNVPALTSPSYSVSTRERFKEHEDVASTCNSCHSLMDGIGWGFEQYDSIGRWRTKDGVYPVTGIGTLIGSPDVDGAFTGLVGLAQKLAASKTVKQCFNQNYFTYALGRPVDGGSDAPSTMRTYNDFADKNMNVKTLIASIAKSPAFLYRNAPILWTGGGK